MASLRSSQQRILKRLWSASAASSTTTTVSARQAVTPSSSLSRHPWHRQQQQAQRLFLTNSSSFLPWHIRRPEKGTGFDNFLPKEKEADEETKEEGSSKEQGQKSSGGGGNSGNNKNNNPNDFNSIITLILTVLIGLTVASNLDSGRNRQQQDGAGRSGGDMGGGGGDNDQLTLDHAAMAVDDADASLSDLVHHRRIITWNEFLRLLRHRQIQRIVISSDQQSASSGSNNNNNNHAAHARVYVKQRLVDSADQHGPESGGLLTHDDQHAAGGQLIGVAHQSSNSNPAFYYRMPIGSIDAFERKLEDAQKSLGYGPGQNIPVQYTAPNTAVREVMGIVPGVLIALALYGMLRFGTRTATGAGGGGGIGGIFQFGKSTHKRIKKEDIKVTFADVAGCDEAKKEIMEFVDFLKDAERFTTLGAKIPKGALLCGPPGTYRLSCVFVTTFGCSRKAYLVDVNVEWFHSHFFSPDKAESISLLFSCNTCVRTNYYRNG
jgi:hypothetical protein